MDQKQPDPADLARFYRPGETRPGLDYVVPPLPEPPLRRGLAADQFITDEVLTEDEEGCE